jgi:hypothetical protein
MVKALKSADILCNRASECIKGSVLCGTVSVILSLSVFAAPECRAQQHDEGFLRREVYLEVGGSFFTANQGPGQSVLSLPGVGMFRTERESVFSKTARVGGGFRHWFRANEALEASFSYAPNRLRWEESLPDNPAIPELFRSSPIGFSFANLQTHTANFALNYVRMLPSRGKISPFLTFGAGVGLFRRLETTTRTAAEAKFVLNFGAGADLDLGHRWRLRFQVRDYMSGQPTGGFLEAPGGVTHNIVPSAALAFRF